MAKRYPEEFKEAAVRKMLSPELTSVTDLSRQLGVTTGTLYSWKNKHQSQGSSMTSNGKTKKWTAKDKLTVIIETASLNEIELSQYCRKKGLFKDDIEQCKNDAISGCSSKVENSKMQTKIRQADKKKIKKLERELRRKEKALAETAALLVLSKKLEAILGETEEG